jgi:hypothetical protein
VAASFLVVLTLFALQVRAGADPAIGAAAAPKAERPRQGLIRSVVIRRVIEHEPREGQTPPSSLSAAPAAPAPAPAPVTTGGS